MCLGAMGAIVLYFSLEVNSHEWRKRMTTKNIDEVLQNRGETYGPFKGNAHISQSLKQCLKDSPSWGAMENYKREALEMIVHKIARILNGNSSYVDSWTDISGYAQLVEKELRAEKKLEESVEIFQASLSEISQVPRNFLSGVTEVKTYG